MAGLVSLWSHHHHFQVILDASHQPNHVSQLHSLFYPLRFLNSLCHLSLQVFVTFPCSHAQVIILIPTSLRKCKQLKNISTSTPKQVCSLLQPALCLIFSPVTSTKRVSLLPVGQILLFNTGFHSLLLLKDTATSSLHFCTTHSHSPPDHLNFWTSYYFSHPKLPSWPPFPFQLPLHFFPSHYNKTLWKNLFLMLSVSFFLNLLQTAHLSTQTALTKVIDNLHTSNPLVNFWSWFYLSICRTWCSWYLLFVTAFFFSFGFQVAVTLSP